MKRKYSILGFTILEVMITMGLLAMTAVGVMHVTQAIQKNAKADSQRFEFTQVTSQIQSILRDEYSCEANLVGLNPSGTGTVVTDLKRKKSDGSIQTVFSSGNSYGATTNPIFLKKMEIKNYNTGSGMGDFVITMNKGRRDFDLMTASEQKTVLATSQGMAVITKVIKLNLVLDGAGKIKDCLSDKDDYTAGACSMLNGDWSDKVKCKSLDVFSNGAAPSITTEKDIHVKSGLRVGSGLTADPGDGMVKISNSLDVGDNATVKNDTTITTGKLIFSDGDARINQVAGNNLYIENKAGTAGANVIAGKAGVARTTVTPTSVTINKNGTIGAGLALEVIGNTTLTGSGSTTVTLKVGNADVQYNGTNLVLNKPTGGVVQYKDGSTIEEVASQGFVNAQLGKALTGDSTTLTTLLANLATLVSGNPIQAISASVCGFYTNMTWSGTRCVDNRTTYCPGTQVVRGFSNGAVACQQPVLLNQNCPTGQVWTGVNINGLAICTNADTQIGSYIDSKIAAALKPINAKTTCAALGGTPNGASTQCNYNQACTYSRVDDMGCHACPHTGAPSCNAGGCTGNSYVKIRSCGPTNAACQVGCKYTSCNGNQACTCNLSTDGQSCTGNTCGSCN